MSGWSWWWEKGEKEKERSCHGMMMDQLMEIMEIQDQEMAPVCNQQ